MIEIKETGQSKLDCYKQQIDDKMKLALVISSLLALKKEINSERKFKPDEIMQVNCFINSQKQFILLNLNIIIDKINDKGYTIDFDDLYISDLYKEIVEIKYNKENSDKMTKETVYIYDSYEALSDTIDLIHFSEINRRLDIVSLLMEGEAYQVIMELLITDKISQENKLEMLKIIFEKYPEKLNETFNVKTKTNGYSVSNRIKNIMPEVDEQLKELLNKNMNMTHRLIKFIELSKTESNDSLKRISFLVDHEIIDIQNKVYDAVLGKFSDGKVIKVNTLTVAYLYGNEFIRDYFYRLPSYKNQDGEIRNASDKYILSLLASDHDKRELLKFIGHKNYESTPEKFELILSLVEKYKKDYKEEDINKIIDIVMRKTKKEDYKEIKKMAELHKTNTDPEAKKEKRSEFTKKLGVYRDHVIAKYPAGMKIGSITEK